MYHHTNWCATVVYAMCTTSRDSTTFLSIMVSRSFSLSSVQVSSSRRHVQRKQQFHQCILSVSLYMYMSRHQFCRCLMTDTTGPVTHRIRTKLTTAFSPQHLDVVNESSMHNVPKGSETHFKVVVVADQFEGKSLIQRHRMVNAVLQQELRRDRRSGAAQPSVSLLQPDLAGQPGSSGAGNR